MGGIVVLRHATAVVTVAATATGRRHDGRFLKGRREGARTDGGLRLRCVIIVRI